jgi:1-acyl-sn-glycerol-3-phosphate acyltransferase
MGLPLLLETAARSSPRQRWRPGLGVLTSPLPELPGWRRRFLCRLLLLVFGPLIEVENPECVAALRGPLIFACNHSNAIEAVLVPTLLAYLRRGRRIAFLADWMFLHLPPFGWLLRLAGVIPVYRKRARFGLRERWRRERAGRSTLGACLDLLASGDSVGIFPEGTRNPDPERLLRGRSGVGALALASGAAVIPVGVSYPAAARLGRAPRLGRMTVRIGEPLRFAAAPVPLRLHPLQPHDRWLPRRATAEVMAALAHLSGKQPPPRRSEER